MGNTPMRAENAALYAGKYSLPISSGSVSWPAIVTEAGGGVSPWHATQYLCLVVWSCSMTAQCQRQGLHFMSVCCCIYLLVQVMPRAQIDCISRIAPGLCQPLQKEIVFCSLLESTPRL